MLAIVYKYLEGTVLLNPHNVPQRWVLLLLLFYKSSGQLRPRTIYLLTPPNPRTSICPPMPISTRGQVKIFQWAQQYLPTNVFRCKCDGSYKAFSLVPSTKNKHFINRSQCFSYDYNSNAQNPAGIVGLSFHRKSESCIFLWDPFTTSHTSGADSY